MPRVRPGLYAFWGGLVGSRPCFECIKESHTSSCWQVGLLLFFEPIEPTFRTKHPPFLLVCLPG